MSDRIIRCSVCGADAPHANGPCAHCGGPISVTIQLRGQPLKITQGRLGMVNDQPRRPGDRTVDYLSPLGSRSMSTLAGDQFELTAHGPVDVGRSGERRVINAVVTALRDAGLKVDEGAAQDEHGEDHVLYIGSERAVLQVVTVPNAQEFWGSVARGTGSRDGKLRDAISWIHDAVEAKSARYAADLKRSMLLLIDAAHAGVLADTCCTAAYLQQYGDPSGRHGFAGVWLVGPAQQLCMRLGNSRW